MMERKTFKELYEEAKKMPTPAQAFISEIAELTHRSEFTVRMWLSGQQVPDELVQAVIAKRYDVNIDGLFPKSEQNYNQL